jgi:CubicO group peptidase (beta-lactamase class C family)
LCEVRIVLPPEVDEQRAVRDELAYGYVWWLAPDLGQGRTSSGGFGGQYVTVVPALELVAVTTADVPAFTESAANPRRRLSAAAESLAWLNEFD